MVTKYGFPITKFNKFSKKKQKEIEKWNNQ
jgi:hypothetical protein